MGDSQTLDQLKTHYRIRFYRDRAEDLPELRPGTNVLSAIKDYFNASGNEESPGFSRSSFFADSVTNANIPESIQKKQGSSTNPGISKFSGLHSTGEINKTKMKATTSPSVGEKVKSIRHLNNFDVNVISEDEMDDCESDMPLNLVVEREDEIVRPVRNASRDRMYSSDSSVVQRPPSPASELSPQKRLRYSDAVVKDKEGFASVFGSRYNRSPADDVQTVQIHEYGSYAANKNDPRPSATTAAACVAEEEDEFVIEDDQSINMSFSVNKRSSVGNAGDKETKSAVSSSTHEKQKLQRNVSEVFSEKSPFGLRRGQSTRKENSSKVNRRETTDESRKILSSEIPKETKSTPSSDTYQKLSVKSNPVSEQLLPCSNTVKQTRETNKDLEMTEEEKLDLIWDTNRERINIPKSKAERSKSSCVSHQMLEIEPAEVISKQSAVQSETENPLKDDKTNKVKDKLCKDKNSFTSHLIKIANSEPLIKRTDNNDIFDLRVMAEDEEFVIHDITDFDRDSRSWNKNAHKISKDSKKDKKTEKNVLSEVCNAKYTSARKSDNNVTASKKSHNDATDSSSPLKDKKEKKSKRTEVDNLVLQKYFLNDIDNQNESTSSRPKRIPALPSAWWVVKQAGRNTTFEIEEALPQHSLKSKRKATAESKKLSECQNNKEERFEKKERRPLDQNEETFLKESDKSSESLNNRKRRKKLKPVERKDMAGPSKVKKRNNKVCKGPKPTSTTKSLQSTKFVKQLDHETQESGNTSSHEHDLNVCDLPNEVDHLSTAAISVSSPVSEPQCPSPHRHKPISDECSKNSSASGSGIQLEYLENCNHTEESEAQRRYRLRRPSHASPAKLTFQSGPVLKSRAVRCSNQMDDVVRNLTSAEKEFAELKVTSECQNNKEERFDQKGRRPLDQDEDESSKESDKKASKTLNTRKRTKKLKPVESKEMSKPSKVKKGNKACKKSQTSTNLLKQMQHETWESDAASSHEINLNVCELPNEVDCLSTAAVPASPPMSEPPYLSPHRHKHISDECSKKSSASGISIQLEYLEKCKSAVEPHPNHRFPQQSHNSPAFYTAESTFQSGPVLKTRAVQRSNQMDGVVRNLTSAESLNIADLSSMAIVYDPETNSDTLVECLHYANSGELGDRLMSRSFNNLIFSSGKIVLRPMEEEIRDSPECDILIFYIIRGRITLKLHKSYHSLNSGDSFFIPPSNTFHIQNLNEEEAELIFTQLKSKSD